MLERLIGLLAKVVLGLFLLSVAAGLLLGTLQQGADAVLHPKAIADVLVTLVTGLFGIGLMVRLGRALSARDGHSGHERVTRARRVRLAVRRPAQGAPIAQPRDGMPEDPDPALAMEED
jgi:TctA family transporter